MQFISINFIIISALRNSRTKNANVAQSVVQLIRNQQVAGSIPVIGSILEEISHNEKINLIRLIFFIIGIFAFFLFMSLSIRITKYKKEVENETCNKNKRVS